MSKWRNRVQSKKRRIDKARTKSEAEQALKVKAANIVQDFDVHAAAPVNSIAVIVAQGEAVTTPATSMPPTPPPPRYDPPTDDPQWRDWMRTALFSPEDKLTLLRPRSVPSKLPYPFKPCAPGDEEKLSASAKAALSAHIAAFEERMGENDAPGIRDMLISEAKAVYDAELAACGEESAEGAHLLYLHMKDDTKDTERFDPIVNFYADHVYKVLDGSNLSAAAFKVFAAHVSTYPGCAACQTSGSKSKSKSKACVKVAVSQEGSIAFRMHRIWKPTPDQLAAKAFYDLRVEACGVPPASQHEGAGMPCAITRRRPTAVERALGTEGGAQKVVERNFGFQYPYDETSSDSDNMFAPPPKHVDWEYRGYQQ